MGRLVEIKDSRQDDNIIFPDREPGRGLFIKVCGKIKINFSGPNIITIKKKDVTKEQKIYQIQSGKEDDSVVVPTQESIVNDYIDFPFLINHNSSYPTHEFIWNDYDYRLGFPQLVPLMKLKKGDEITFDYNY